MIGLFEVLEGAIRPAHWLPEFDVPLLAPLAGALAGVVIGIFASDVALVFLNRIFRLIYRDHAFFVKHFPPRGTQPLPDRAENFDHGEIHGLGHVLRGRCAVRGHLKTEGLGLSGDCRPDHRLANAVLFSSSPDPLVEVSTGTGVISLVIVPNELLDAGR